MKIAVLLTLSLALVDSNAEAKSCKSLSAEHFNVLDRNDNVEVGSQTIGIYCQSHLHMTTDGRTFHDSQGTFHFRCDRNTTNGEWIPESAPIASPPICLCDQFPIREPSENVVRRVIQLSELNKLFGRANANVAFPGDLVEYSCMEANGSIQLPNRNVKARCKVDGLWDIQFREEDYINLVYFCATRTTTTTSTTHPSMRLQHEPSKSVVEGCVPVLQPGNTHRGLHAIYRLFSVCLHKWVQSDRNMDIDKATQFQRHCLTHGNAPILLKPGVKVTYRCAQGQILNTDGPQTQYCQRDGSWRPAIALPRCKGTHLPCRAPSSQHLYFESSKTDRPNVDEFAPSEKIKLGCAQGYRLEGRHTMQCLSSGDWDHETPTCVKDSDGLQSRLFLTITCVLVVSCLLIVSTLLFLLRQRVAQRAGQQIPNRHNRSSSSSRRRNRTQRSDSLSDILSSGSPVPVLGGVMAVPETLTRTPRQQMTYTDQMDMDLRAPRAAELGALNAERLALLSYLEDGAGLPSYDEAIGSSVSDNQTTANIAQPSGISTVMGEAPPDYYGCMMPARLSNMLSNTLNRVTGMRNPDSALRLQQQQRNREVRDSLSGFLLDPPSDDSQSTNSLPMDVTNHRLESTNQNNPSSSAGLEPSSRQTDGGGDQPETRITTNNGTMGVENENCIDDSHDNGEDDDK